MHPRFPGSIVLGLAVLLALTVGLVRAAGPTVIFDKTIPVTPKNPTCFDIGGKFRADELAFDPADNLLLVANDADGFLSLIDTRDGHQAIVDQFFYADSPLVPPHVASVPGLLACAPNTPPGTPPPAI